MTDDTPTSSVALGRERQSSIYRSGVLGRRPAVPTDFAELERRAKRVSSVKGLASVAGGAGEGRTMRNNGRRSTGGPSCPDGPRRHRP